MWNSSKNCVKCSYKDFVKFSLKLIEILVKGEILLKIDRNFLKSWVELNRVKFSKKQHFLKNWMKFS